MEEESELNNGLTNKSKLFITVIEAKDLSSENLISDCNPSVVLSFQDETQETKIKNNTINPRWYENFNFKINAPSGALRIEVFDNPLMGKKSLGFLSIDITDLMDQKKRMQWYDLYNESNVNCGKIYLKIQCIINFKNYYEGEIENAEKEMAIIQNAYNLTNYNLDCMKFPFGLLFVENLDDLLNNNPYQQADDLINILERNKESIYNNREGNNNLSEIRTDYKINEKRQKITLNPLTKILMYCFILLSFGSLLERSDFINLMIAIITLNYFIFDKSGKIIKYLTYFTWLLGGSILMDFVWFFTQFGKFFIGETNDPESWLKRFIYIISVCGTIIKCLFILALRNIKRKRALEEV